MIEMRMVIRMAKRAVAFAPVVVAALWIFLGPRDALSGALGIAMALLNLWVAARIIGGVADNNPGQLLIGGFVAFTVGLVALTGVALLLHRFDIVSFPVTGFALIGTHMVLVVGEAASTYPLKKEVDPRRAVDARS